MGAGSPHSKGSVNGAIETMHFHPITKEKKTVCQNISSWIISLW